MTSIAFAFSHATEVFSVGDNVLILDGRGTPLEFTVKKVTKTSVYGSGRKSHSLRSLIDVRLRITRNGEVFEVKIEAVNPPIKLPCKWVVRYVK